METMPDDVANHILLFVPPSSAVRLYATSSLMRKAVYRFYTRFGEDLVGVGGPWSHLLKGRVLDKLRSARWRSPTPAALATLLEHRCGVCQKPFRGAQGVGDFGLVAHDSCLRPFLWNRYYPSAEYGVPEEEFERLPHKWLEGFRPASYQIYEYLVVWKQRTLGLVPYAWTAHHFLRHDPVVGPLVESRLRERREAEARRQSEAADRARRGSAALAQRLGRVQKKIPTEVWDRARSTLEALEPAYFQPDRLRAQSSTDAAAAAALRVASLLDQGIPAAEIGSWAGFRDPRLTKGAREIARANVSDILQETLRSLEQRTRRCLYTHPNGKQCANQRRQSSRFCRRCEKL